MNRSTAISQWTLLSVAAALSLSAAAQQPTVLKGKGITEGALIEALTPKTDADAASGTATAIAPSTEGAGNNAPEARPGGEGGSGIGTPRILTRSIRVTRDRPPLPLNRLAKVESRPQASILITFETNSATLTATAKSSVDVVAKALQADKLAEGNFIIEGHADPRGDAEFNRRLSQARAESVVAYLVAQHAIARERLKPVGKGDSEPMNTKEPDAAENRRVTIIRE